MKADWMRRVTIDSKVLSGKPVIKCTRISVAFILELLANGWTEQEIIENYPQLVKEDIWAAKWYL